MVERVLTTKTAWVSWFVCFYLQKKEKKTWVCDYKLYQSTTKRLLRYYYFVPVPLTSSCGPLFLSFL